MSQPIDPEPERRARRALTIAAVILVLGAAATALAWHRSWEGPRAQIDREAAVTACIALTVLFVAWSLVALLTTRKRRRVAGLAVTVRMSTGVLAAVVVGAMLLRRRPIREVISFCILPLAGAAALAA